MVNYSSTFNNPVQATPEPFWEQDGPPLRNASDGSTAETNGLCLVLHPSDRAHKSTISVKSDLRVVLLAAGRNVIYVLLAQRLVPGGDVILLLLRPDCVVHINLSDPSRNHHLRENKQTGGLRLKQEKIFKIQVKTLF